MNLARFCACAFPRGAPGLIAFATLVASSAVAGDTLTLDDAMARALRDAPQLEAALASVDSAESAAAGAGRLPDPELVLGVDNLPVTGADQFSLTRDFMTMRRVGVMQTVPAGAKRRFRSAFAERQADVARAELRAERYETAGAAAEAWIAASIAEQTLHRVRSLRDDLDVQSAASRAALASGRANAGDALASAAALAQLDDELLELEQRRVVQRAELARWVGDDANRPLGELPWKRELGSSAEALFEDVPDHPPLAPLVARVEAARTDVDLARAEKRPDWSAELSYSKRGPDYSDMVSLEFRVGLPLFTRHRQDPAIAAKLAMVRTEEAREAAAVRMHRAEIESMAATWRSGRKRLEHFEATLLPLARDRSRAALSSYGAARSELRAVLDALRDEADAQRDYVALEGEVTRAWVFLHLLHSTGETP